MSLADFILFSIPFQNNLCHGVCLGCCMGTPRMYICVYMHSQAHLMRTVCSSVELLTSSGRQRDNLPAHVHLLHNLAATAGHLVFCWSDSWAVIDYVTSRAHTCLLAGTQLQLSQSWRARCPCSAESDLTVPLPGSVLLSLFLSFSTFLPVLFRSLSTGPMLGLLSTQGLSWSLKCSSSAASPVWKRFFFSPLQHLITHSAAAITLHIMSVYIFTTVPILLLMCQKQTSLQLSSFTIVIILCSICL